MASVTNASDQVLEAMIWSFGKRECRTTLFVDDVALSLEDEYFDLNIIDEDGVEQAYYVWLDGGTGTDPLIPGKTALPLVYTSGDTATVIAGLYVALLATVDVHASNVAGLVTVENKFLGLLTAEVYTNAPSLVLDVLQAGTGGSLGAIAVGGAEVSTTQSLEDIMKDSEGETLQDQIVKGSAVGLTLGSAEMSTERWESLIGNGYGASHTENLETLTGFGTSKLYHSSFSYASQLVGHPKRKLNSDRSSDVCIWLAVANMTGINYSGDSVQVAQLEFNALPDRRKPEAINLFARGDHSLL